LLYNFIKQKISATALGETVLIIGVLFCMAEQFSPYQ